MDKVDKGADANAQISNTDTSQWQRLVEKKGKLLLQKEALKSRQEQLQEYIKQAQAISAHNNDRWGVKEKVLFDEMKNVLPEIEESISKIESANEGLMHYADNLPHKGMPLQYIKALNATDIATYNEATSSIAKIESQLNTNQDIEKMCQLIIEEVDGTIKKVDDLIAKVEQWLKTAKDQEQILEVTKGEKIEESEESINADELKSIATMDNVEANHGDEDASEDQGPNLASLNELLQSARR